MIKMILLLFSLTFYSNVETFNDQKAPTDTYRSDQYRPGLISEYIKLTLSNDRQKIKKIEYWYLYRDGSTSTKSEVYELKFRKSERYEGEEVGNKGELMLPETEEYLPFINAEGMLDINHGNDMIQTFEIEM